MLDIAIYLIPDRISDDATLLVCGEVDTLVKNRCSANHELLVFLHSFKNAAVYSSRFSRQSESARRVAEPYITRVSLPESILIRQPEIP